MNTVGILSLVAVQAQDWAFGQQIWDDVFSLLDRDVQDKDIVDKSQSNEYTSLASANMFKHYLHFLTASTLSSLQAHKPSKRASPGTAASKRHIFDDSAVVRMFATMARHNIAVSSGLLCQGIRSAFEVGQIEIADVLEQWQLQRERSGAANDGYLREYFGAFALPEIPASQASILELVRGSAQCPQLSRLVAEQMRA
ncbi:hypothetical protein FBU59_002064 [Linderina macrospora]|uniref:Uncharacterized protein n=1 Tax=Linderina macrospora TaxID=4868 RepID=A0ACC1JC93_9FUNG|nr:hypothetical protein FBU59_002064 [Linderina macrospora]